MKVLEKTILNPKFLVSILSIFLSLLVGCVIIKITGNSPIIAYGYMLEGALGSTYRITEVLVQTTPLIFTGLAITFAYRSGVFSIGADGQLLMGSLFCVAFVTTFPTINGFLLALIGMTLGIIGGALWGAIAGALKSYRGISEIISTMMLNYIALYFASYLYGGPLKSAEGMQPRTAKVTENVLLPRLVEGTRLHLGLIIAIVVALIMVYVLYKTVIGTRFRAVGLNPDAAQCLGINVKKYMMLSLAISGALAGLGGTIELFSVQNRVQSGFCADYGFDGIAVALMGQLHPIGVVLSAIFFACLKVGANYMELMTDMPSSAITVIQGVIIVFVACGSAMISYKKKKGWLYKLIMLIKKTKKRTEMEKNHG